MARSRRRGGQIRRRRQTVISDSIELRNDPRYVEAIGLEPGEKDVVFENIIKDKIRAWKGFDGRPGQVAALYYTLKGSQDVLLQAPTGYGKSVIWELAHELGGRTVLMISPLNILTEQQVQNLPPGSVGLALTHINNNKRTMKDILNDVYTHICTSPEIACGPFFHKAVIARGGFRDGRRPLVLIIDEVHMVEQWSKFRVQYSKIRFLRYRLPNSTKLLGVSGTLDDETRRKVIENGGFRCPVFLNTVIDRPEIHIEFRADSSIGSSYSGLRFLFPDELPSAQLGQAFQEAKLLPKTMIFFDRKKDQRIALALCRKWLEDAGLESSEARKIVGIYHASIREREKAQIRQSFFPFDSEVRIMLVTEAMGMGVEIPGIQLVIQYGAREILRDRSMLKTVVQRMGRAARGVGESGWFIWLLPTWFFAAPDVLARDQAKYQPSMLSQSATIDTDSQQVKVKASDTRRYAALDPIYKRLGSECPRRVLAEFFTPEDSALAEKHWPAVSRCCYLCDRQIRRSNGFPSRSDLTIDDWPDIVRAIRDINSEECRFDRKLMLNLPADVTPTSTPYQFGPVWLALLKWRGEKLEQIRQYCSVKLSYAPDLLGEASILPDRVATKLAQMNNMLSEELGPRFLDHFVGDWALRNELVDPANDTARTFGDEALAIIRQASSTTFPPGKASRTPMTASKVLQRHTQDVEELRELEWIDRQLRRRRRYGERIPYSAMPGDIVEARFRPKSQKVNLDMVQNSDNSSEDNTSSRRSPRVKGKSRQRSRAVSTIGISQDTYLFIVSESSDPEGYAPDTTIGNKTTVRTESWRTSPIPGHQHIEASSSKAVHRSPLPVRPSILAKEQRQLVDSLGRPSYPSVVSPVRLLTPTKRKNPVQDHQQHGSASDTGSDSSMSYTSRSGRVVARSQKFQRSAAGER